MKLFKSHFSYSKSQRNGIFALILLVFCLQGFILYGKFGGSSDEYQLDSLSLKIQRELDSLELLAHQPRKIKPFNPNYISDYKGYQLGIGTDELDRLFTYRKQDKYVNSASEFQKITQVSDSLLQTISPYFKFPDWVNKSKKVKRSKKKIFKYKKEIVVKDINTATQKDLEKVYGIGEKRAQIILKYRKRIGGFSFDYQFDEVWGLTPEVLENLKVSFKVFDKPEIQKINVNTATVYQLKKLVYISYKQAKSIIEYRKEVAEIQNLAELKTISNFPVDKYDLISLYLHAQ